MNCKILPCIADPVECAAGYYSEPGWAKCKLCDAGFTCVAGSNTSAPSSGLFSHNLSLLNQIVMCIVPG